MAAPGARSAASRRRCLLVLAVAAICALQGLPRPGTRLTGRTPAVALVEADEAGAQSGFVTKVVGAAAQGATAAMVAAILSACTEPIVNRLLVKRMTFADAYKEITFELVSKFFLTTFPTNMLKFPIFEVINMALSFTALSGQMRGIVNGWLFCTIMLPVTNYRFRKSMNWEIKPALLYQAYVPTVVRDIVYGWARGSVGGSLEAAFAPTSPIGHAFLFGITVFLACVISSPGNEWRGYTLQPKEKKLPFAEYFKPVNYVRSTGVGATIMGIALMVGMLVTPYAAMLFDLLKAHKLHAAVISLVFACYLAGSRRWR